MLDKLKTIANRYEALVSQLEDPATYGDPDLLRRLSQEQKELERADRMDERKRMLRERAAWLSWQVETGVLAVGMLSFVVFTKRASLAFFHGVLILWWARMLAFELFRWLLEKKY